LEQSLAAYDRNEMARTDFLRFLTDSIGALEGVPYSVRIELRTHEKNIETEGYFEEEGFESKTVQAKDNLALWLKSLKALYGTGDC
jgi:hypothetical protein